MKPIHFVWAALAVAVGIWLFTRFGGGPEVEIRAQLDRLEELIDKDGPESALAVTDRARRLGGYFTDDFVVVLPGGAEFGDAASLARPFVGYRHGAETIDASFSGIAIEVDGPVATSTMTASIRAGGAGGGLAGAFGTDRSGTYRVDATWRERGEWRIERLEVFEDGALFQ